MVEIALPCALVELVDFQAGGLGRCRVVAPSGEAPAEAHHLPAAARRRPVEHAEAIHTVGEVYYLLRHRSCGAVGCGEERHVVCGHEARLLLAVVGAGKSEEVQLADVYLFSLRYGQAHHHLGIVGHGSVDLYAEAPCRGGGEADGLHGCAAGGNVGHFLPFAPPAVHIQAARHIGRHGVELAAHAPFGERDGAHGGGHSKLHDKLRLARETVDGHGDGGGQVAVGKREAIAAPSLARLGAHRVVERGKRLVAVRERHSQNADVAIMLRQVVGNHLAEQYVGLYALVLVGAGGGEALRKGYVLPPAVAGDGERAPCQLLHSVGGRHPRAAHEAPPRRRGYSNFQPQAVGQGERVGECVLPFGRHVVQAAGHHLRRGHAGVEHGEAADARLVHPQQVLAYAVFRYVAVHPVPPHARLGLVGGAGGKRSGKGKENEKQRDICLFHGFTFMIIRL